MLNVARPKETHSPCLVSFDRLKLTLSLFSQPSLLINCRSSGVGLVEENPSRSADFIQGFPHQPLRASTTVPRDCSLCCLVWVWSYTEYMVVAYACIACAGGRGGPWVSLGLS